MKIFKIHTKQKLPITIEEGWGFLSNPKNLSCITPNYMKFKITDCDFKPVYQGQIIQYTVRPLLNIPLKWVTEITHVVNENYFVDEQRFGPYSLWHHKHFLREIDGGIETLECNLPLVLGAQKGLVEESDLIIPNMRGIMMARQKPLETIEAQNFNAESINQGYNKPDAKKQVKLVKADEVDKLIDLLENEAKVI